MLNTRIGLSKKNCNWLASEWQKDILVASSDHPSDNNSFSESAAMPPTISSDHTDRLEELCANVEAMHKKSKM